MLEKTNSNLQLFIRQWKKVFVLYFIWTCLYLVFSIPFWIQTGWLSPMAFVDYAFATVTEIVDIIVSVIVYFSAFSFIIREGIRRWQLRQRTDVHHTGKGAEK